MTHRVERHKWWNADKTRLVNSGDPDAAFLAYPAGTELAESEASRVGLISTGAAPVVPTPPGVPDESPAEKMRASRLSNKVGPRPVTKAPPSDEETL
jgi:hypothetical protein